MLKSSLLISDKPWRSGVPAVRGKVFSPAYKTAKGDVERVPGAYHYAHAEVISGWSRGRPWGRIFPADMAACELERQLRAARTTVSIRRDEGDHYAG